MPFWRKSEDPWDMEPEKRRTWTAGEPQPPAADGEAWKVPGEKETAEEQTSSAMTCPWCGKDMEQGFLMSGRGVFWYRGIPTGKARWLSPGGGNIMRVDTEGFLTTYHTAWYCPDCKKMTIDAADLQTEVERNQAAFPVGAEETASQSDEAKEGE